MYLDLSALKKNLKKDSSTLPVLKVALLGDNPTQLLNVALKGYAVNEGYNLDIYEAEYNQIDLEILHQGSELYETNPRFVLIFQSTQKLLVFSDHHNIRAWRAIFFESVFNNQRSNILTTSSNNEFLYSACDIKEFL